MNGTVLIQTGDVQLFLLLKYIFGREGFLSTLSANTGNTIRLSSAARFDFIFVDSSAEPQEGIHALRQIRSIPTCRDTPVGVLLESSVDAMAEDAHPVDADLTISRPFDPDQLLSFLRELAPCSVSQSTEHRPSHALRFSDIEMNPASRKVWRGGQLVELTALHFRMLQYLMENPGIILSRADFIAAAWPADAEVDPRTVDIHIGHIRRSLKRFGIDVIRTVRSGGYVLEIDDGRSQP